MPPGRGSRDWPRASARPPSARPRRAAWPTCSRACRKAATKQDVDAYLSLRWEFYGTCYRTSGRRRLVLEVERLYRRSERYNRLVLSSPDRFRESLHRYESFQTACFANDGPAAEAIVQESLRWAVDTVAAGLPSEDETG